MKQLMWLRIVHSAEIDACVWRYAVRARKEEEECAAAAAASVVVVGGA